MSASPNIEKEAERVRATSISLESDIKCVNSKKEDYLACPICYETLTRKDPSGFFLSVLKCEKCNKSYTSKDVFLDLTTASGMKHPGINEFFRNPLVSFLYERGYRHTFKLGGFPGPSKEFKMAQEYFEPVSGGLLVDVCCGSGLFSRKFAKSSLYSTVIALDFSENMLRQVYEFSKQDEDLQNTNFELVRADVAKLPFPSCSIDAVHAGAALHCWPAPSTAMTEISRVLRSGGVFVGTTYLSTPLNTPFSNGLFKTLVEFVGKASNSYKFCTEEEIEYLCKSCGLINYSSKVQQGFIMFSAQKP